MGRLPVGTGEGEGGIAVFFAFSREVNGLPVTFAWPVPKTIKDRSEEWNQEYVTMCLSAKGEIWRIDFQNMMEPGEILLEETFLLPFSEIRKIFESVISTSFQDYGTVYSKKGKADCWYTFTVDSVRLGYLETHEPFEEGFSEEGRLAPVWDFFGTVTVSLQDGNGKSTAAQVFNQPGITLLTINAMDGTVIER